MPVQKHSTKPAIKATKVKSSKIGIKELEYAYNIIVTFLTDNTNQADNKLNFEGSPLRAAKALMEMNRSDSEISKEVKHIIHKAFPIDRAGSDAELIVQGPIELNSICPHHLMPVMYEAYVAYIPDSQHGSVLGLSKLSRLSVILGRRPVLQEKLAVDIAEVLCKQDKSNFPAVHSAGSAVSLVGIHCCMACRGITSDALTSTTILRGVFRNNDMEAKFYQAINNIKTSRLKR